MKQLDENNEDLLFEQLGIDEDRAKELAIFLYKFLDKDVLDYKSRGISIEIINTCKTQEEISYMYYLTLKWQTKKFKEISKTSNSTLVKIAGLMGEIFPGVSQVKVEKRHTAKDTSKASGYNFLFKSNEDEDN